MRGNPLRAYRTRPAIDVEAAATPRSRLPVVRSGTALEVAEVAWNFEGVGREAALTIPAVAACRAAIVGTIVQLPAYAYRGDERLEPGYLLTKPDPSTTWIATIAGTVDDLLFHGRAYWRVLERDSEGFPRRARWEPHRDVQPETRSSGGAYAELLGYRIAGLDGVVPVGDVIRFDGQAPAVLETGARTLAGALELEERARTLAAVELPAGVLKNEGTELGEEEAEAIVLAFEAMRRDHGVAFLQGLEYQRESVNAADLQLIEARHNVATDVARLFSVPVAMIGASPSGGSSALLYSNLSQQLAILVSSACAPHLKVVEATLTDVYPRGQAVAFDVQSFLRGDPQAAADYALGLLAAGVIDVAETRSMLGIPSSSGTPPDLTPGRL
jgi:phage portal protein BeeE